MHDRQWVRIGFAFVLASTGIVAASVAGCGDDNGPGAMPGNDASNDMTVPQPEAGGQETGTDAGTSDGEASVGVNHAHVYVVHASETAPPLRFCFGIGGPGGAISVSSVLYAEPQSASAGLPFPGVFPGTGGLLNDHGIDLSTITIAAYAIDATKIALDTADGGAEGGAERNCEQLLGANGAGGALTMGTDYWLLGTIPQGQLARGTSWVFAVTGCLAGANATQAPFCGMGYSAASSNLGFTSFQLDNASTAPADKMGAQLAHASWAWQVAQMNAGAGVLSAAAFYEPGDAGSMAVDSGGAPDTGAAADSAADTGSVSDASSDATEDATTSADSGGGTPDSGAGSDASAMPAVNTVLLALNPAYGKVSPMTMDNIAGLTFDGTSGLAMTLVQGVTPLGQPAAFPLPIIQQLTYGQSGGVAFANGMTFAFVLVGNPTLPTLIDPTNGMPCAAPSATCIFNGRSVHFLAFPAANN
jgi:hypothetical protein